MSELRVPLDYEQLAETSQLRSLLRMARTAAGLPTSTPGDARNLEATAAFLFNRLFVVLGYLARSTNKPGRLTVAGAMQLRESLDPLFGDNCDPVKLMEQSGLLEGQGEEWHCHLFARLNEHLAGDYRPKHIKGNDGRQVTIAIQQASINATQQLKMLIPEVCQRVQPDGRREPFDPQELDRVMLLIGALDKIFKFIRQRSQFTEPLLNAAAQACIQCNYTAKPVSDELRSFLGWLISHRDNPRVPATTEQLLNDFEVLYAMSKPT